MSMTTHDLRLWQFVIDAPDTSDTIRQDAQRGIETLIRAQELHRSQSQHLRLLVGQFTEHHQTSPRLLHDDLQTKMKHRLHDLCDERINLIATKEQATIAEQISREALRRAELTISSRLFTSHADGLLAWVARRRADQPFTCGLTETITADLVAIYQRIRPQLFPRHDPELGVPETMDRLPLIIEPSWTRDSRSGLAWMWQQIADGHFDYVPHPHDKNGQSRTLRITNFPTRIPQAPELTQSVRI